jgi:long-chain acyl-CoA synthetase
LSSAFFLVGTFTKEQLNITYFLKGCTQIYTNLRSVKKDLKEFKPNYMLGVPRLWESIYEGVQKQFREQPEKKQRLINSLLAISDKYIKARRIAQNLSLNHLNASAIERLSAIYKHLHCFPFMP